MLSQKDAHHSKYAREAAYRQVETSQQQTVTPRLSSLHYWHSIQAVRLGRRALPIDLTGSPTDLELSPASKKRTERKLDFHRSARTKSRNPQRRRKKLCIFG